MGREGKTGVSKETPKNIMFGAGTFHKGLKYTSGSGWNFATTIVGATNGGSTLNIIPEYFDVPVDGKNIKRKGLKTKIGEEATLVANMAELTEEIVMSATAALLNENCPDSMYDLLESKPDIDTDDYWENVAFVGKTLDGRNIIAILDNALCTSGLPLGAVNRDAATTAFTFTCHAGIEDTDGDLDKLPWHIYYPKPVA